MMLGSRPNPSAWLISRFTRPSDPPSRRLGLFGKSKNPILPFARPRRDRVLRSSRSAVRVSRTGFAAATVAVMLVACGTFRVAALATNAPATTNGQPAVAATVSPLAPAAPPSAITEDIRDIRPPYHLAPGWLWLVWIGAGCGVLGIAYALWRARHRLPGLRPKLPFELALDELQAARALMQPEHARAFSIRVSEIVRKYIEVRFATRAAHHTTEEFLHDCLTDPASPLATHRELLGDFLYHCDLAKFARWVLAVPEMEAMLASASTFVRNTGPETPPAVPGTKASASAMSEDKAPDNPSTFEPQPS
jgi:hypothetical protein